MTDTRRLARLQPATLAFVVIGVTDFAAAVDFWTRGATLRCGARDDERGTAELSTTDGEVSVVLSAAEPRGLQLLAYAVPDLATLEQFAARLTAAGVSVQHAELTSATLPAITFTDPDGYPLALVVRTPVAAAPVPPNAAVQVEKILHPLIQVRDLERAVAFYGDVLGFEMSDRIADVTAFMRCADRFHHSLAITVARKEVELEHICFHLPDLDTLMRARNRLRRLMDATPTETFRHGGSESITFYFRDPHSGEQIEFCTDHRSITADDHQPRVLPAAATTFDMWERFEDSDLAL